MVIARGRSGEGVPLVVTADLEGSEEGGVPEEISLFCRSVRSLRCSFRLVSIFENC